VKLDINYWYYHNYHSELTETTGYFIITIMLKKKGVGLGVLPVP
jgi:hypothetical protein